LPGKLSSLPIGSAYIDSLMPMLKQHLSEAEYAPFRKAIPALITAIHNELEKPVYAVYPELEAEIGAHVEKFGQLT